MTEESLKTLLTEWQKRLRLQDWGIFVKTARLAEMQCGGQGECEWVLKRKEATIVLVDPIDYPLELVDQDMEETLVHELLHLHFVILQPKDGTAEDTALEQAIVCISEALVKLKREGVSRESGEIPEKASCN